MDRRFADDEDGKIVRPITGSKHTVEVRARKVAARRGKSCAKLPG
ncbi:hypothetical protein ACFPOU_15145 [Massilia jejuensis]|uniref:Uncharacterized protein n=1 Tax=Massilia jejuensis TaxID=648894 RepID=A0ABW0PIH4_9BURK